MEYSGLISGVGSLIVLSFLWYNVVIRSKGKSKGWLIVLLVTSIVMFLNSFYLYTNYIFFGGLSIIATSFMIVSLTYFLWKFKNDNSDNR